MSDQPTTAAAAPETAQSTASPPAAAAPAAEGQSETKTEEKKPEESTTNGDAAEQASSSAPAAENKSSETPAAADSQTTPAKEDKDKDSGPQKPDYLKKNPALSQFFDRLAEILKTTEYSEMWGVSLQEDSSHAPTINVLIKYLRANEGNVKLAETQLTDSLKWRKSMNPIELAETGSYSASKFAGMGYLTNYKDSNGKETVVTWNIYGGVKDLGETFGDMDEFIKWRVALMELAVKDLKLNEATTVMDYDGEDPYQMVQVHDYLNVSFLRMNPKVKAATKKTIEVFAMAYPELLSEKFFVNVPTIMGWMFTAMKVFLSKNTTRKFHPITNGVNLAREFPALADQFPAAYGGKGPELQKNARTVNLDQSEPAEAPKDDAPKETNGDSKDAPKDAPKEESKEEPKEEAKEAKEEAKESKDEAKELPAQPSESKAEAAAN